MCGIWSSAGAASIGKVRMVRRQESNRLVGAFMVLIKIFEIVAARSLRRLCALCLLTLAAAGCVKQAEPRWLVRALPGSYPEIVYFVPTQERAIGLTIDDGLDNITTPLILDVLRAHGATATFFVVSNSLVGREDLVRRILREGHELGHHMTEDHPTVELGDDELIERFGAAARALEEFSRVQWFRPGHGRYDDRVLELVVARGYRIAMASIAPLDTVFNSPRRMARFVNWMVEPGSIVVLHDSGDRGHRTAETLELLLPRLLERRYRIMNLSELDRLSQSDTIARLMPEGVSLWVQDL